MYEEMTYENIMADMMEQMPDGLDTSEGSLIWNSCSKIALRLEDAYSDLAEVYDNMMLSTMDLDHLLEFGAERGVTYYDATNAYFKAQFNMAIEEGTRFEHTEKDYTYYIVTCDDDENHIYTLQCEDEGSEPNNTLGDIEPIDYIEGFESGVLLSLEIGGEDAEDTEVYRNRLIADFDTKAFAGNKKYYIQKVNQLDGVGGVRVQRVTSPHEAVTLTILSSTNGVPTDDVVTAVQEAVDPTSGGGDGLAPIGAAVTVKAVTGTTINVAATVTYEDGITYEDVQSQIEGVIDDYISSLCTNWQTDESDIVVRRSKIEAGMLDIEGIKDVENVKLNDAEANVTLTDGAIPIRGTITC